MNNCLALGCTGEKFIAKAKEIRNADNLLDALSETAVTFFRDSHGVIRAATLPDEAATPCLGILLVAAEFEAAYALLAGTDATFLEFHGSHKVELSHKLDEHFGDFWAAAMSSNIPARMKGFRRPTSKISRRWCWRP